MLKSVWNWESGIALAIIAIMYSSAHLLMFFGFSPATQGTVGDQVAEYVGE